MKRKYLSAENHYENISKLVSSTNDNNELRQSLNNYVVSYAHYNFNVREKICILIADILIKERPRILKLNKFREYKKYLLTKKDENDKSKETIEQEIIDSYLRLLEFIYEGDKGPEYGGEIIDLTESKKKKKVFKEIEKVLRVNPKVTEFLYNSMGRYQYETFFELIFGGNMPLSSIKSAIDFDKSIKENTEYFYKKLWKTHSRLSIQNIVATEFKRYYKSK